METSDINILLQELKNKKIIGIDGMPGVGKTTIVAKELSERLNTNMPIIELDTYLPKDKTGRKRYIKYVKELNYQKIRDVIQKARNTFIIEGVLLCQIIEKLDIELECLIYVKSVNARYYNVTKTYRWIDETDCDFQCTPEDKINEATKQGKIVDKEINKTNNSSSELPQLIKDLFYYNKNYRPFDKADHIYLSSWE